MVGIIKQTGTVNKNSGIVVNKKMIAEIVAIIIVALVALAGIQAFQTTNSQQKNAQQAEQQTTSGLATSSLTDGGQKTILGSEIGWLTITGEPLDFELRGYKSFARVYVYANGKIDAKLTDENLMAQQKAVEVKVLLKDGNNKMFETAKVTLGRTFTSSFIGDWGTITGIKDPTKLQWQPQFTIVDRRLPGEAPVKRVAT